MKERENFRWKTDKGGVDCLMLWLVDLNYNLECDWLIELFDNKLFDKNLASELVDDMSFFKPITIEEIVIFMSNKFMTIISYFNFSFLFLFFLLASIFFKILFFFYFIWKSSIAIENVYQLYLSTYLSNF